MTFGFQRVRYVIQFHRYAGLDHYDFMLEVLGEESLRTFQLPDEPTTGNLRAGISCRETARHRREYLTYEGEVSRNRGTVAIWDSGLAEISYIDGGTAMRIRLVSDRDQVHPEWMMHFTGGPDWHVTTP